MSFMSMLASASSSALVVPELHVRAAIISADWRRNDAEEKRRVSGGEEACARRRGGV